MLLSSSRWAMVDIRWRRRRQWWAEWWAWWRRKQRWYNRDDNEEEEEDPNQTQRESWDGPRLEPRERPATEKEKISKTQTKITDFVRRGKGQITPPYKDLQMGTVPKVITKDHVVNSIIAKGAKVFIPRDYSEKIHPQEIRATRANLSQSWSTEESRGGRGTF